MKSEIPKIRSRHPDMSHAEVFRTAFHNWKNLDAVTCRVLTRPSRHIFGGRYRESLTVKEIYDYVNHVFAEMGIPKDTYYFSCELCAPEPGRLPGQPAIYVINLSVYTDTEYTLEQYDVPVRDIISYLSPYYDS